MLTPVYARRIVIFSSLFIAVCAGYIAGRRAPLPAENGLFSLQSHNDELADPATVLPHSTGGGVTVSFKPVATDTQPRDAPVEALLAMTEVKTWQLLLRPAPNATWLRLRLEIREAGKAPVIIGDSSTTVNYSPEAKGKTLNLAVSLMPTDGTMNTAKNLRTRIALQESAVHQDIPNPFRNHSAMGTVDSRNELAAKPVNTGSDVLKRAEIKLTEITFGRDAKAQRKKVLFATFEAEYRR